ncbi:hypothetical protein N7530_008815 [Penicillium desertorum]|uniref:Short-chain dehydrogenase n=1 Tax=Penicillium desertorum TaxID=1303715 RepID=A0A9X0BLJ3_9EURO|nr:hypothetical protein N7530_008815 [Penicillium desertorum]
MKKELLALEKEDASLSGKVALITGGVKNLGAQSALELAGEGANLALHYHSSGDEKEGASLGDLTSAAAVTKLFKDVVRDFAHVDIVVNTVGRVLKKPITEISEEEYDTMFAVNSKTAFLVLKEAATHVTDGGKIISIVTALLGAFPGYYTSYAGSKAPVEHFTRGVCKEVQSRSISVNNVAPGPMDTPFFYPQESPEAVGFHKANGMGNRLTMVKDIAPIIRFLCTDGASITGQTIFANGGYTTR